MEYYPTGGWRPYLPCTPSVASVAKIASPSYFQIGGGRNVIFIVFTYTSYTRTNPASSCANSLGPRTNPQVPEALLSSGVLALQSA